MTASTRPLDRGLVTAALNAYDRYRSWLGLALYWRRRGARNTARACLQFARHEAIRFDELLLAAEASS